MSGMEKYPVVDGHHNHILECSQPLRPHPDLGSGVESAAIDEEHDWEVRFLGTVWPGYRFGLCGLVWLVIFT